jgi:hypothetical protein
MLPSMNYFRAHPCSLELMYKVVVVQQVATLLYNKYNLSSVLIDVYIASVSHSLLYNKYYLNSVLIDVYIASVSLY